MSSMQILDLVVGVIYIYFILSIICSSIVEMLTNVSKIRAKMLESWLIDNFNTPGNKLGTDLLKHPLIDGLTRKGRKPSYIPSDVFIRALFDDVVSDSQKVAGIAVEAYDIKKLKSAIQETKLLKEGMKRTILQHIEEAGNNVDLVRKNMEHWFDSAMERLGGNFKKNSQLKLFLIGLFVSIALNVDTVVLIKYFYQNPDVAKQIADQAQTAAKDSTLYKQYASIQNNIAADTLVNDSVKIQLSEVIGNVSRSAITVDSLHTLMVNQGIPLGWQKDIHTKKIIMPHSFWGWVRKLSGLLVSAFALSMGGVFWFDLLNKLVNLRGAGSKPAVVAEPVDKTAKKEVDDKV